MVRVEFLGPINKESMEIEASSLKDLAKILQEDAQASAWLEECAVAINDVLVDSLEHALHEGDRVSLLPPVCGG